MSEAFLSGGTGDTEMARPIPDCKELPDWGGLRLGSQTEMDNTDAVVGGRAGAAGP